MNDPIADVDDVADEGATEVVRIKLRRAECSAVVGELRAADRTLERWIELDAGQRTINFEVVFQDGSSLCGSYGGKPGKKNGALLSRLLRRACVQGEQAPPDPRLASYRMHRP